MKSPLQDRKIQTNCKACVFSVYDGNTQTGCLHNRIEKFQPNVIEAYDNDKEFYVINGMCNLYRNSRWNSGDPNIDKAFEESSLTFDCFIDCSDISENDAQRIIDFVASLNYYKNRINWYLFHLYETSQEVKNNVMKVFVGLHKISPKISVCVNKGVYLNEFSVKSNSTYHVVLDHNSKLDVDVFSKVNNYINIDIKKFIISKINDSEFISNIAYRMGFIKDQNIDYYKNLENLREQSKTVGMYLEI